MTNAPEAAIPSGSESAGGAARLLERLADRLGARASVTSVFGEPIVYEDVTIVPVASFAFGFGGGTGREVNATKTGEGGGGGAHAKPLGYIEIKNGNATYRPIRDPWTDVALAWSTAKSQVSTALNADCFGRRLGHRRRHHTLSASAESRVLTNPCISSRSRFGLATCHPAPRDR